MSCVVASSGTPSKNRSVPMVEVIVSGVVMDAGIGVVIFMARGACRDEAAAPVAGMFFRVSIAHLLVSVGALDEFEFAWSPAAVEERLQRTVEAEHDPPATRRVGLDPVSSFDVLRL